MTTRDKWQLPSSRKRHILKPVGSLRSGSGRTIEVDKRKACSVVLAIGCHRSRRGGGGPSRLLAQQNELARPFPRLLLPSLHGLRNQASLRRRCLSWLWSVQLRPSTITCLGSGQTPETQARRVADRASQRLLRDHLGGPSRSQVPSRVLQTCTDPRLRFSTCGLLQVWRTLVAPQSQGRTSASITATRFIRWST